MSHTKLAGLGIPGSEKIAASTVIIVTSLEDLISVRWLGDNWGVILPTRQEPVHQLLSFGINSLVTYLTLLVNNVFINSSRPTPS